MLLYDEVKLLKKIPYFSEVAAEKLKLLAFASERISFEPGDILYEQGDGGDSAYVILSGRTEAVLDTGGKTAKLRECGEMSVLGESTLLFEGERTNTVRALTDVEALKIKKEIFLQVVQGCPETTMRFSKALAQRMHSTTATLDDIQAQSTATSDQGSASAARPDHHGAPDEHTDDPLRRDR